ncbi:MAG: protein translocase subunit SecF [Tepidamorphaceae bacterium]|nr:protein translocase subunit SecF [Rhodobiaceae bacterium]MCC0047981.1 protein translocase subunit SecF [Rhodobiaceae bacterium]
MRALRLVPDKTTFRFMRWRTFNFTASIAATILSLVLVAVMGLNFGIDFRGGTLIEIQTKDGPADIAQIRELVGDLGLGDVQIQEFGAPNDVLIRVEEQDGGELAQQAVIEKVKAALGDGVEYRRVEIVGPQVSGELVQSGVIAVLSALFAILIYIWFRFEWQYAIGAVVSTSHDVVLTLGLFAAIRYEFNLSSIAAVLTIVGYSLNDTVVVYDRIRDNLRRYKKMPIAEVIDLSVNDMLSRTVNTSLTTLLALFALYIFGGEVIRGFAFAMIWGVIVGTYSSTFIGAPILIFLNLRPGTGKDGGEETAEAAAATS